MNTEYPDTEDQASDKYARLSELLRQTLTLASEIAEDKGHSLPGECIIVQRRTNSDPTEAHPSESYRQDIRRSLLDRKKALKLDDSEDSQVPSPSPGSSVQEPFSPGSVAVSLDAVVEKGKTSGDDLCILDNASATSATPCPIGLPSNRSSLLLSDEGQHSFAGQTSLAQFATNENAVKRLQRPSFPQRNTSMIVHNGQESPVEATSRTSLPQQVTHNSSKTPAQESPLGLPARPRTSKSQPNSETALKTPQKSEEESREGDSAKHNHQSSPKWHVRILPISPSRDPGSAASSPPSLIRVEAVFPLQTSTEGNATCSLSYNGEPSYFLISQPPVDSSSGSPRLHASKEGTSVDNKKTLQEFIDEWEYDAEAPGVEDKKL